MSGRGMRITCTSPSIWKLLSQNRLGMGNVSASWMVGGLVFFLE